MQFETHRYNEPVKHFIAAIPDAERIVLKSTIMLNYKLLYDVKNEELKYNNAVTYPYTPAL